MAQELLNSCDFSLQNVKKLYIASRKLDTTPIDFPLEYNTISGSSDTIIRVNYFNADEGICVIGGQTLEFREVFNVNNNISFTEEYEEGKQGKLYVKNLNITMPRVDYQTNAALKEFLFSADGQFATAKVIAFIIDENDVKWICGETTPLILQSGLELSLTTDNQYRLSFQSKCIDRMRSYEIQE